MTCGCVAVRKMAHTVKRYDVVVAVRKMAKLDNPHFHGLMNMAW